MFNGFKLAMSIYAGLVLLFCYSYQQTEASQQNEISVILQLELRITELQEQNKTLTYYCIDRYNMEIER